MTYDPSPEALQRVAAYVQRALDTYSGITANGVSRETLDIVLTGTGWLSDEARAKLETSLEWRRGDIEWIARGGEPSRGGGIFHRKWRVRVVVERVVEAPTQTDAIEQVCGPVRDAFHTEHAGIVECTATNMQLVKRRDEQARQGQPWG